MELIRCSDNQHFFFYPWIKQMFTMTIGTHIILYRANFKTSIKTSIIGVHCMFFLFLHRKSIGSDSRDIEILHRNCYYAFFLVCCGCDTSYIVAVHIQCRGSTYTSVVSRAFMVGAASQAGDADSSRAPGLISGLQGSVNVHRGALLLVPQ